MDCTEGSTKDEFFGVIAIDEKCNGYVSMYKKGDETGAGTVFISGLDKNKLKLKTKEKQEHIKKLYNHIKKQGTFMHNGALVTMQELVVAACDDYGDVLEKLAKYSHTKPKFVQLPRDSKDPIADAIQAKTEENESFGSADCEDAGTSGRDKVSTKGIQLQTDKRKISGSSTTSKHEEQVSNAGDQMDQTEAMTKKIVSKIDGLLDEKLEKVVKDLMDQIISKIDGMLDEKLENIIKEQDRSFTAKGRAPSVPGFALGFSPSPEPTPCLLYNIQHAPSKVSKIEQQFFDRLEKKLSSEMKQLQEKSTGPSVVFAINSSRIQADIQRDLKSVTFTGPTLLMIIKPMREPDRMPPSLLADDLAGFPLEGKDCHYLLVDNNNTALHDCDVNSDTVDAVARFIAKNQSAKK